MKPQASCRTKLNRSSFLDRLLWVCAFILIITSSVSADWKDFLPVSIDNGAELRFFGSWEADENKTDDNNFHWNDTLLKERITIHTRGFSYDPRFLQYYLEFSGGYKQENYKSSALGDTGWVTDPGFDYDARAYLLPDKPYNLELYATRLEPLFRDFSATQINNVDTNQGVLFRYRNKPWFFDAKYENSTITSNDFSSNTKDFSSGGSYFKEFAGAKLFSVSGNYDRRHFKDSLGLNGDGTQYYVTNIIRNNRLTLSSSVTKGIFEQDDLFGNSLESDSFSVYEYFIAYLPWNFTTDAQYQYQDNKNAISTTDQISSIRNTGQVSLKNQLYQSLYTEYAFRYDNNRSDAGESTSRSHFGFVNYIKHYHLGDLLATLNVGRNDTETNGGTAAVNESHPGTPVPGSFLLNESQQVDSLSIQVFLKSPLPPNELILLQENVDYSVLPESNRFRIQIFNLPSKFAIPGTYDFVVTYNLTNGTFELQTDNLGYTISFDFFRRVRPYYNYSRTKPEVLSGALPGPLFDSSTTTAGVTFHRNAFEATAEYQKLDWDVSPYDAWRLEARYSGLLTPTLNLTASAEYLNRNFPRGTSLQNTQPFREERTLVGATLQKYLMQRALRLSAGGSYSRYQTITEGNAYSLNASIAWTLAKLDFTLGANVFRWESMLLNNSDQRRFHQYYYLNVGRKLF